jgi:hypothetical protein
MNDNVITDLNHRLSELTAGFAKGGVVDVKIARASGYSKLALMKDVVSVMTAIHDGEGTSTPYPCNDSLRGLVGGESTPPNKLSPVTRCGGASEPGDYNEDKQEGGTTAS